MVEERADTDGHSALGSVQSTGTFSVAAAARLSRRRARTQCRAGPGRQRPAVCR